MNLVYFLFKHKNNKVNFPSWNIFGINSVKHKQIEKLYKFTWLIIESKVISPFFLFFELK